MNKVVPYTLIIEPEYIACLIIIILLLYTQFDRDKVSTEVKSFKRLLFVAFSCLVLNVASIIILLHTDIVSGWVRIFVSHMQFGIPLIVITYIFCYVVYLLFTRLGQPGKIKVAALPFVLLAILYHIFLLLNVKMHWLFYFDEQMTFIQGPLYRLDYYIYMVYVGILIVYYIKYRKLLDYSFTRLAAIGVPAATIVFSLQLLNVHALFTDTAIAIALLVIFISLQQSQLNTDTLTGLRSRTTFFKTIDAHVAANSRFCVLIVEVRDMKKINVHFDQQIGDLFLKQIARYLNNLGYSSTAFRMRSTDFAMIFLEPEKNGFDACLNQMLQRFEQPWLVENASSVISVGLVGMTYPDCSKNKAELIAGIEYSLALSKEDGEKNKSTAANYLHFDHHVLSIYKRREYLIELLHEAIEKKHFRMCYQPLFCMSGQEIVGAEALLRLNDRGGTAVSPAEFIPLAEELGLISEIGAIVLELVCRFIHHNNISPDCYFTVNISAQHFVEKHFASQVVQMLDRYNVLPSQIKLEITERVLLQDTEYAESVIRAFQRLGIGVFLDDFGTGYSNLFLVSRLPFECIKFDGSLISDLEVNPTAYVILSALIDGVNRSKMKVLAEGVETQQQQELMQNLGTEILQGFYLSRPLEAEAFWENYTKAKKLTAGFPRS